MKGRAATHVVVYFTLGKRGDAKRVRLVAGNGSTYEMFETVTDALSKTISLWRPISIEAAGMPSPATVLAKALLLAFGETESAHDQPGVTWVDGRVEIEIRDVTP